MLKNDVALHAAIGKGDAELIWLIISLLWPCLAQVVSRHFFCTSWLLGCVLTKRGLFDLPQDLLRRFYISFHTGFAIVTPPHILSHTSLKPNYMSYNPKL